MQHEHVQPDFGTGQKKLSVYITGVVLCVILTLVAFWAVMSDGLLHQHVIAIIFSAAILQFFVQVIFFLRLNAETEQGRINLMAFVFTGVILLAVIGGSLWIMVSLHYFMMH